MITSRSRMKLIGLALLGVLCISMSPIFVRFADVPAAYAAFFRAIYALPILMLQILWTALRSKSKWHLSGSFGLSSTSERDRFSWLIRIWFPDFRVVLIAVFSGMLLAGDLSFWHRSIGLIGAGLATLIGNSQVVFVSLFAALFLREKVPLRVIPIIGLLFFGGWLALGRPQSSGGGASAHIAWMGFFFAIIAAIFYSFFLLSMRRIKVGEVIISASMLFWLSLGTAIGALIAMIFDPDHLPIGFGKSHFYLVCVALCAQVLGWQILSYSLPRLRAYVSSALLVTQPVMSMCWGWILCGEKLDGIQLLGFVIVLLSITLMMIPRTGRREIHSAG